MYQGGNQEQRMIRDKVRGLKKALLYSYQAATAILSDNREFRCLINPDKNKPDYDNKIISIPFKDICLNKRRIGKTLQGEEDIGMKPGDVFTWKENNSHWLVFLRYLTEKAYFLSEIRRCDNEVKINNKPYWVYIRGPVETEIVWNQKKQKTWNDLNYSLVMFITADNNTNDYFSRFKTMKILDLRDNQEKTWEIQDVNFYYGDGILQIFLKEFFENSVEDAINEQNINQENENDIPNENDLNQAYIEGPSVIAQYSINNYTIKNLSGGKWFINWFGNEIDLDCNTDTLVLENPFKQQGNFVLIYRAQGYEDVELNIKITTL